MTRRPSLVACAALAAGLLITAGCTTDPPPRPGPTGPPAALRLVAFSSCDDVLTELRKSARERVGPDGFGDAAPHLGDGAVRTDARAAAEAPGAAADRAPGGAGETHSKTNTHEAGADEPDLVKTDGRRIVTVNGGVLRVVDAGRRAFSGSVDLGSGARGHPAGQAELLLHGDRALVVFRRPGWSGRQVADSPTPSGPDASRASALLVDLAGDPRMLGRYAIDGALVDARQIGERVRLVVRSTPRLTFPQRAARAKPGAVGGAREDDAERVAANQRVIDRAGIDAWLPGYEVDDGGGTRSGRVPCERLSRPATYSGTAMLTVLSFDLTRPALGDGDPTTVLADGDTVYSNGASLYVTNDRRWQVPRWRTGRPDRGILPGREAPPDARPEQTTEIYKFDVSGSGRPRYVAAGAVPGWLINQYAMSEWDGRLRIATTTGLIGAADSESHVRVLAQRGGRLTEEGRVSGLGRGERIYGVRFAGPAGYVVTFRETDPLYTLDLSDPARPRATGELKITGYSAYLHPVGDRLIGVGQEASTRGTLSGAQVSLFDVSDPRRPGVLARYHVEYGHSTAEFDPHAFLYWPADRLLVVPMTRSGPGGADRGGADHALAVGGVVVLRVGERDLTELGTISQPTDGWAAIRRTLVVGRTLWTVSDAGLYAVDMSTLDGLAWLPYPR